MGLQKSTPTEMGKLIAPNKQAPLLWEIPEYRYSKLRWIRKGSMAPSMFVTPMATGEVAVDVRDKGDRWDRPTEQR